MIKEDYVSFETAKLLKEKGFDGECLAIYYPDGRLETFDLAFNYNIPGGISGVISAPTLQMAMKWLREVHNIAIETEWEHIWYVYIKSMTSKPSEEDYYKCESSKYEEACEMAIKYCLENMSREE